MSSAQNPPNAYIARLAALPSNGVALMLLSVVFFTAGTLLVKYVSLRSGLSFWTLTLPRFAVGLLLVRFCFRGGQAVNWKSLVSDQWMVTRGVVGGAATIAFYLCIVELGAGRVSILYATYPIFAALIAPLVLPEPIRPRTLLLGLLAIAGIALMTGPDALGSGFNAMDGLAALASILSGLVVVSICKLHNTHNTATIFASQCVYGLAFCAPGVAVTFEGIAPIDAALILGSAVLVSLGQITMTQGFKTVSAGRGSSLQLLNPPLTFAGAFLLFGERLGSAALLGAAIILFASYRLARSRDG